MVEFAPALPSRRDLDWCWYLRRQGQEGEALERVLHDIGVMHPGGWADWAPSTLTATGAPVEMQLSDECRGLALLTEVADPASDPDARVTRVCEIMTELGSTAPGRALRDGLSAAQGAGRLRYGAWLGLRQKGRDLQTRLFAELPDDAQDLTGLFCPPGITAALDRSAVKARTRMLSVDGATGEMAVYFDCQRPTRASLATLAAVAQVSDKVLALALAGLAGRPEQDALPVRRLGFSLTMKPNGTAPVLQLQVPVAALRRGHDHQIAGWLNGNLKSPVNGYAGLLDALQSAGADRTHHRLISLTARPGSTPALTISVAAPWSCPLEPQ